MSHSSTASITLGRLGAPPGVPMQQYSAPPTDQYGQFSPPEPTPAQTAPSQAPSQAHSQAASRRRQRRRQNIPDHMREARMAPKGSGMCTEYTAKPTSQAESTTPAAAYQTQTLFPGNQPQVQRQGDVLYGDIPTAAPQQNIQNYSERDERRAAEAREKLIAMNLSPALIEQYRRKFTVLDLNKDGVVNLREFAAISRVLGYKFSKMEILEIFGRRDLDDSGGISFDEFVIAMYERSQKAKELAPYREKFRLYDWKDRGYITSDEAFPVLNRELGFDENKTEMMIDMFDKNKDYRLSLLEFIDFYKKVEELKQQVAGAFRDFDRNGDGFVDAEEAKAVLLPKGFSDQQVDALMFKYDRDADDRLNYKEFAAFWDVQLM